MIRLSLVNLAILVPPLLILEGLFSGAEIALLSADKLSLKKQARNGLWGAKAAIELAGHPERILATTLLMTNLSVIAISSLIALYCIENFKRSAELIAILVTSPMIVLIGELAPKTFYQRHATRLARWVAPVVSWTFLGFFPLTRILSSYTTRLSRLVGPIEELLTGRKQSTREEIRSLLSYSRNETEIKSSERRMIKRIFDFKDTEAKHALIPLVRVEAIEKSANVGQALERFESHRHSRMPVYSERVDNITGVLEASDLFGATDLKQPITNYISAAHYVAETQVIEELLREMRHEDNELVVVVDEHGGAVGILTFEDIVEEIVGEISDEYDTETAPYKMLGESSWLVQARMEIQQINDVLKIELPQGDYETLSGFLLQQFGRIPEARAELHFTTPTGTYRFTIRKATERHIESVLIELISD